MGRFPHGEFLRGGRRIFLRREIPGVVGKLSAGESSRGQFSTGIIREPSSHTVPMCHVLIDVSDHGTPFSLVLRNLDQIYKSNISQDILCKARRVLHSWPARKAKSEFLFT